MDALEFLKEWGRMCDSYKYCDGCPLADDKCIIGSASDKDRKEIVTAIEQWLKEHPRKTRQSVFLEQWPEATLDEDGYSTLSPCGIYKNMREECDGKLCVDCRHEFWMQEVE